jgi:hypothetical protein
MSIGLSALWSFGMLQYRPGTYVEDTHTLETMLSFSQCPGFWL